MPYKTRKVGDLNVKMESFKVFFENKDADIEDIKKMIIAATKTISDPRFKEYGGRDNYIKMLKKKLARLEEDEQSKKQARSKVSSEDAEENEIIYVDRKDLIYPYNDYGYNYKGYQLEVKEEVEPGERNFYFFDVYDPKGNKIDTPKGFKLIDIYGELNEQNFKSYIDSLTNSEDAEDRCKRKADSVYGKKTSAYKSGAIVRCRKGEIWEK